MDALTPLRVGLLLAGVVVVAKAAGAFSSHQHHRAVGTHGLPAPRPDAMARLGQGTWSAHGVMIRARGGGALQPGDELDRPWFFTRRCDRRGCAVYWSRPTADVGVLRARVHGSGPVYSATFHLTLGCTADPNSSLTMSYGRITSRWTLTLVSPDRAIGDEHFFATTANCRNVDQLSRWTARRLGGQLPG
jgi:hypothetical protein